MKKRNMKKQQQKLSGKKLTNKVTLIKKEKKMASRPVMRQVCDIVNKLEQGNHFTIDRFMEYLAEDHKSEIKITTVRQVLALATREGYLTSERVAGYKKICYIKLHKIPEKEMSKLITYKRVPVKKQKEEPISNIVSAVADSKSKSMNVLISTLKDMENVMDIQDKKVTELKTKIGELFDENTALRSQLRILNAKTERMSDGQYKIDTKKFYDNLE